MFLTALLLPGTLWARHNVEQLQRQISLPTGYMTDMVWIPAGSFPRGTEGEEFDEQPVRMIYLDDYLIDKYEVTVAQWGSTRPMPV